MDMARIIKSCFLFMLWAKQLRVHHWAKNIFVFPPLLFSGLFLQSSSRLLSLYLFILFCALSSSVYIFNDILDLENDKVHPKKKYRPLVSGLISKSQAIVIGVLLCMLGLWFSAYLNLKVFVVLLIYVLNNILYSTYLKNKVLADVISITIGFMLRLISGALIINVEPSRWFLICGFSLSLFLAFGKRRAEMELLNGNIRGTDIRPTLEIYTKEKLNTALSVVNSMCILSYILFVTDRETILRHQSDQFIYTVPIVVYCLFRYMYKAQEGKGTGPVDIIFKDKAFVVAIFLWLLITIYILYGKVLLVGLR
jgi:4-hydroxybenzoate polyprenyltransferase